MSLLTESDVIVKLRLFFSFYILLLTITFSAVRNNLESNKNDPDPSLTLGQMIKWLVCISSGMKYLSDKKMVHRDLRNC